MIKKRNLMNRVKTDDRNCRFIHRLIKQKAICYRLEKSRGEKRRENVDNFTDKTNVENAWKRSGGQ